MIRSFFASVTVTAVLCFPETRKNLSEHSILAESDPKTLRSDVLKIGHHGSKNSTTPDFLAAVQPRLAVISSGAENAYGHPAPQLLDRLRQSGIPTLRTDTNGAIHILTDGKTVRSIVLRGVLGDRRSIKFGRAADATESAKQLATVNIRARPDIRDFSYIARTKRFPHSRQAASLQ